MRTNGKVLLMLAMFAGGCAGGAPDGGARVQRVGVWTVHEISLRAAKDHADPFGLDLRATFTGPGGRKISIPAFWDGKDEWKVRFSPPASGTWTWRTICPDPSDAGLHNRTGRLEAVEYVGDNPLYQHGFLKVSPSRRHLVQADGAPFFWVGDTNWAINRDHILDQAFSYTLDDYFAARARQKFNVVQYHIKVGRRVGQFNGWPAPEEQALSPRFYQRSGDRVMAKANAHGMVVALFASWRDFFLSSKAKTLAYYRNLIARYGAYHVVWVLSGEYSVDEKTIAMLEKIGHYVKSLDGHGHLVTVHPVNQKGRISSSVDFHNSDWLDFNMIQAYDSHRQAIKWPLQDYNLTPAKPTLEAESMYVRNPGSWRSDDPGRTDDDALWVAYVSVLQGSITGYTYGNGMHHVLNRRSMQYMRHFGDFFRSLAWWELVPHRDWVTGDFEFRPLSTSKPFCAAAEGKLYVVYIPEQSQVRQVSITNLGGLSYRARRYDPKLGLWTQLSAATPPGESWEIPALPLRGHWLVVLDQPQGG